LFDSTGCTGATGGCSAGERGTISAIAIITMKAKTEVVDLGRTTIRCCREKGRDRGDKGAYSTIDFLDRKTRARFPAPKVWKLDDRRTAR
jgi:hypothetical protein